MKEHSILTLDNADLKSAVLLYLQTLKTVAITNDASLKIDAQGNVIVEFDQDIGADPVIPHPIVLNDASARLLSRAIMDVGKLSTKADRGTVGGELGCADAVTRILHDECGFAIDKTLSTDELFQELKKAGWQEVEPSTTGSVIVSPTVASTHGHTGIVGENEKIYSNDSQTGIWSQNFTVSKWLSFFTKLNLETHTFVPPNDTTQDPKGPFPLPGDTFKALGSQAPIRGTFPIDPAQLRSISTGVFSKYLKYVDAIVEDCSQFHINPLFVLANMVNENVNSTYNNPLGISGDNYPLGERNGIIPNGPRKFSEHEWRQAFDKQFSLMATGELYKNCNTIDEWAKVDAPVGAENDPHGTNKFEGRDVGNLYDRLVKELVS